MSKHDIMKDYLEPRVTEIFGGVLGVNFSADTPRTVAFVTTYADKWVKKYLRNSGVKAYGFAVLLALEYSENTDDLNLISLNLAQAFGDWIDAQNRAKNLPDFGVKCKTQKIESLQNMPNLAEVNEARTVAKYMLQCRVTYYEEE